MMEGKEGLMVATVNASGWGPVKEFAKSTRVHAILVQEHKLMREEEVLMAGNWCSKNGWKACFTPAVAGQGGGASGGTAVMVRHWMGLAKMDQGDLVPARALGCILYFPGLGDLDVYSIYGEVGTGLGPVNIGLLGEVGRAIQARGKQFVVGGDFNMEPGEVASTGICERLGVAMVHTSDPAGTSKQGVKGKVLDFFLVDQALPRGLARQWLDAGALVCTHTPACIQFHGRLGEMKARILAKPQALPVDKPVGPSPAPQDWEGVQAAMEEVVRLARRGGAEEARAALRQGYKMWADLAEKELVRVLGGG